MNIFSSILFTNPWLLAALLGLPLIWYILRITPPVPKTLIFPASRFLKDLMPDRPSAAKTPWWILMLRLLITALLILALAGPVINPGDELEGDGPVHIIVDNGWSAAQSWNQRIEKAQAIITQAGRQNREIHITTTAPEAGDNKVSRYGPLGTTEAEPVLRGLTPHSWPADYKAVANTVEDSGINDATAYWLSDGLAGKDVQAAIDSVEDQGNINIYTPDKAGTALLLRRSQQGSATPAVIVEKPEGLAFETPVTVQVIADNGQVLASETQILSDNVARFTFDIPLRLRNRITRFQIAGRKDAGAILLLDSQFKRRNVGIASPGGSEESIPFIEAQYYLQKALEPFATTETAAIQDLVAGQTEFIFLPDISGMPTSALNALDSWVKKGGILVRFAGPHMAQATNNNLLPVPLLKGSRALEGALTWEEPAKLAPFPQDSPFYGLPVSDEITVKQQLLSQPAEEHNAMTWANLADGTPLITAAPRENGTLVFIHTTATTEWSDLVLSGTFVNILKRMMTLGSNQQNSSLSGGVLQPLLYIDGNGNLRQPESFITPLDLAENAAPVISSIHPPGIYGRASLETALNLGDSLPQLKPLAAQTGHTLMAYNGSRETDLKPLLLLTALFLFFADWLIMMIMGSSFFIRRFSLRNATATIAALILIGTASPTLAQNNHMDYANNLHLAYIQSGDPRVDNLTRSGLENLAEILKTRTSVEPAGIVALNPERDEMAFFPVIYWAVSNNQNAFSDKALSNIQSYMQQGGTILIDTRESAGGTAPALTNQKALRRIMGNMDIPPLKQIDSEHVLGRSFYLLRSFPGLHDGAPIWVEENSAAGRDGVSPIIIGSHDWAAAWASADTGIRIGGGNRQRELALRFGVNLVMYALTGNYKADQVHLPYIMERLDQ